jgi:uncharacterized protein (TIGR02757 family)
MVYVSKPIAVYLQQKQPIAVIDSEIKAFLDEKVVQYNNPKFIASDPIYIPHQFTLKEDIEIAGFFSASIAWGSRPTIVRNAIRLMNMMGNAPYDFVLSCSEVHLEALDGFVHRTFNASDAKYFAKAIRNIYLNHNGLEGVFTRHSTEASIIPAIQALNQIFFAQPHPPRTRKHIANPAKGSAAKKINMFLRWMIRNDNNGVDFGLWKNISPKILSCPLDVHSGNVARKLGLLSRKQNDIKAVNELDEQLRTMDAEDPVKYDFALFGLGVFEKF